MKLAEYDTMLGIVKELDLENIEDLKSFQDDCFLLGAKKTEKYIKGCIRFESVPSRGVIGMHLNEDFAGV